MGTRIPERFRAIEVELEGVAPLLMHRFNAEAKERIKSRTRKGSTNHKVDPQAMAESHAYRDEKTGELYIPARMIHAAMKNAVSTDLKIGRSKAETVKIIQGGIIITPARILLGRKDYKIDEASVPNQFLGGARTIIYRPRIDEWRAKFTMWFDSRRLNADFLRALLEEAGLYSGLGAHRPQHGKFRIIGFEPK